METRWSKSDNQHNIKAELQQLCLQCFMGQTFYLFSENQAIIEYDDLIRSAGKKGKIEYVFFKYNKCAIVCY